MLTRRLLLASLPSPRYVRAFGQRRTIAGSSRQNPEQVKLNQVTVQLDSSCTTTAASNPKLKEEAIKLISKNLRVPPTHDAAVILASKSLAPWLDDNDFISGLLGATAGPRSSALKVLTAAVDEVPRYDRNGVFASGEGISIFPVQSASTLLPGLWPRSVPEGESQPSLTKELKPSLEFNMTYMGRGPTPEPPLQVTVPLASTIFQNGKSHVLAATEWTAAAADTPDTGKEGKEAWTVGRRIEKVGQTVVLPPSGHQHGSVLSTSLIPLTKPRKIVAGLGNILRQVEVDSKDTPASKELEAIIPTLIKERAKLPSQETEGASGGPIGVWALIIPKEVAEAVSICDKYVAPVNVKSYKSSGEWELSQITSPYVGRLLSWGCQLRKILSGGGGWGAKQGLLSLDPETTFNTEEHEDLESFIRSFKGEDAANGNGIVTPGSYVQFFAEGIYPRAYGKKAFHPNGSAYALGTTSEGKQESRQVEDSKPSWKVDPGLFGAVSSEGIYVETDTPQQVTKTKIDAPSSYVGIISIISMGDMGAGIAKLLTSHNYAVLTNVTGRSEDTHARALSSSATLVTSDSLLLQADLILSIVPPSAAISTAQRILSAASFSSSSSSPPPTYIDLNAISPSTSRSISLLFSSSKSSKITYLDGAILGPPPSINPTNNTWKSPILPLSGPHPLPPSALTPELQALLNTKHVSSEIGKASALKMVFASLSKGYAALAIQSVVTAHRLGVLGQLQTCLTELQGEGATQKLEKTVTALPPKAGRWVREMEEIASTHRDDGGMTPDIFLGAAEVFRMVAEDTDLGRERIGKRKRGLTIEDVAAAVSEGLERKEDKRKKMDEENNEEN
ncbi:hypothetical protein QBC44DRAFT_351385 [Cladorrhinum sp. PSN332]|nr:hypothetical protein QBC44DRAFT_351385 [Cladorrhinum sp. PSN332]